MKMLRIPLIVLAFYLSIVGAFAQEDSIVYQPRKLKVEEVNFVSSYYHQDGNNAAVTGGVGSERLTDVATTLDLKLARTDFRGRQHAYTFEIGLDTYSSASSDKIDPSTLTSASYSDQRIYPSIAWSRYDSKKGTMVGANVSVSAEYDYLSIGGGINAYKDSGDKSRQLGLRVQTYQDAVSLIYPIEQRAGKNRGTETRKTYSATWSYSQIVNRRLQILFLIDLAVQKGFLSMPFNRVYFSDNTIGIENLPSSRFKFPASVRVNYFVGDNLIIRSFYRYYQDDWGLKSHTAELELPVKFTPFLSVSPFYRYYNQTSADYFAGKGSHLAGTEFYTSDYDLSKFESHFAGASLRLISADGILGVRKFDTVELRYGYYNRQTGLVSNIISLHAKFK
ncbi:MAG TPA: DUF3570 domain-containing protein [Chryseosolibacter sp.]